MSAAGTGDTGAPAALSHISPGTAIATAAAPLDTAASDGGGRPPQGGAAPGGGTLQIVNVFRAAAVAVLVAGIGGPMWLRHGSGGVDPLTGLSLLLTAVGLGIVFGLWVMVERRLLRAGRTLASSARVVAHGTSERAKVPEDEFGDLGDLARAVNALSDKLAAARRDVATTVARATAAAEEQKGRLAAILHDLHEGVVVCNAKHQILLYNQKALDLLHVSGGVGLGRSLLHIVSSEPIIHTLERLTARVRDERHLDHPHGTTAQFIGATVDGQVLLEGRMSILLQPGGADVEPGAAITGYVVTLSDATRELAALGQRDALLRASTEGIRQPVANLRAALEVLVDTPELAGEQRAVFEQGMSEAVELLHRQLEQVTEEYRSIATASWPMSDIHSGNLFHLVKRRVGDGAGYAVTPTGLSQWVHVDSFSMVSLIGHVLDSLHTLNGAKGFDLTATVEGHWTYIDIVWHGGPVGSAMLDSWLDHPLSDALGGLTVGDVLTHHRSTLWSESVRGHDGVARLRMPVTGVQSPSLAHHGKTVSARPEFFDFDLLHQPLVTSELGQTSLDKLHYVVFDTETTGLSPSGGDEIIQIAAVRIVNGRILTGESFSTLVNPRRPIPAESVKFHGITDDMVADQPPIEQVLPRFRAFISGAVVVAHNAAFDLKFLKMKERMAGVTFDSPVLDTMLLSRMLQGQEGAHTLDGIASRLGIDVIDRHTALGDSLVTAAVFLRMIEMLKERDVRTLDDAIRAANIIVELAERERAF